MSIVEVPELSSQEWFSDHQLRQSVFDKKQYENDIPVTFLSLLEVNQIPVKILHYVNISHTNCTNYLEFTWQFLNNRRNIDRTTRTTQKIVKKFT